MRNIPAVVTAASVASFMGAYANAGPTGNPQTYGQSIVITSASSALEGTGMGTGTGSFDTDGTLTVESEVATTILFGTATGTVSAITVYQGSYSGDTWTYSGTATNQIIGCTGSPVLCANAKPGAPTTTTSNPIFTLDILAGGSWNTMSSLAGLADLDTDHTLVPIISPPGPAGDPTAVPTMSAYGLGITAIALFGAAARRLRTSGKRK